MTSERYFLHVTDCSGICTCFSWVFQSLKMTCGSCSLHVEYHTCERDDDKDVISQNLKNDRKWLYVLAQDIDIKFITRLILLHDDSINILVDNDFRNIYILR